MFSPETLSREDDRINRRCRVIRKVLHDMAEAYGVDLNMMPDEEIDGFVSRAGIANEELEFWLGFYESVNEGPMARQAWSPEDKTKIDIVDQKLRRFYEKEYLQKMTPEEVERNFKTD